MILHQRKKKLFYQLLWKAKLNGMEFKARVKKIVTYLDINIKTKDHQEFDFELGFEREFYQKYEPRIELFGNIKKKPMSSI